MTLIDDETLAADLGRGILYAALQAAPRVAERHFEPTLDPTLDAERMLLTAAAVVMAQRARGSRERLMQIVAEQQLFLEARADDAQAMAAELRGRRP